MAGSGSRRLETVVQEVGGFSTAHSIYSLCYSLPKTADARQDEAGRCSSRHLWWPPMSEEEHVTRASTPPSPPPRHTHTPASEEHVKSPALWSANMTVPPVVVGLRVMSYMSPSSPPCTLPGSPPPPAPLPPFRLPMDPARAAGMAPEKRSGRGCRTEGVL